jgi:hypothetical protein
MQLVQDAVAADIYLFGVSSKDFYHDCDMYIFRDIMTIPLDYPEFVEKGFQEEKGLRGREPGLLEFIPIIM